MSAKSNFRSPGTLCAEAYLALAIQLWALRKEDSHQPLAVRSCIGSKQCFRPVGYADLFHWLTEDASRQLPPDKRDRVADELADIFIYLLRLGQVLDVNLVGAATAKLAKNAVKYPVDKAKVMRRNIADNKKTPLDIRDIDRRGHVLNCTQSNRRQSMGPSQIRCPLQSRRGAA